MKYRREYIGVVKLNWDELWHATYWSEAHGLIWDRVTRRQAKAIAARLFKAKRRSP